MNWVGYGQLSTLVGWMSVRVAPNSRTIAVWMLGGFGVLGCYFAAQAFQGQEDQRRGYRTLVVTHGPFATLLASRVCLGVSFLGGVFLAAIGWLPRVCLAAFPLGIWVDQWLVRWSKEPFGGNESWARGLAFRLFTAISLAVGLAYADYFWSWGMDVPSAGLGTAGGHPPDCEPGAAN